MLSLGLALSLHTSVVDYNSIHPHLRVEVAGVISGVYYNSVRKPSFYLGKRFQYGNSYVEVGAVTGYTEPVIPMFVAGYQFSERLSAFASPVYDGDGLSGMALVEFRFF